MDIKQLELKRNKIQKEINKIAFVQEQKREKEMELLIGCCVKGEYCKFSFRKILDFIISKEWGIYFIMEEVKIGDGGEPSIRITSEHPFTNKEWNSVKIPLSGWSEEISEQEYIEKKVEVLREMSNPVKLKKFLITK